MSEKHIEIKIGQDPPHTTDFTAIVDVETGGRLFYEEVFPKHAERFVKCWNSYDALLDACKMARNIFKYSHDRGSPIMLKLETTIAQAGKE